VASNKQSDYCCSFDFALTGPSTTAVDCIEDVPTQTAASKACSQPHDNNGFAIALMDLPLFARRALALEVRNDDFELTTTRLVLQRYRNDAKIYHTLMKLAVANGDPTVGEVWAIRIGYAALSTASGCDSRALGRAWRRLLEWGFLRSIEPHTDRLPTRYFVRSIACLDAIYRGAGCTHLRVYDGRQDTAIPFGGEHRGGDKLTEDLTTPLLRLLFLRSNARLSGMTENSEALGDLLTRLEMPASLLGGKRIASQACCLLRKSIPTLVVEERSKIREYIRELRWVISHAETLAFLDFFTNDDRQLFLKPPQQKLWADSGSGSLPSV
jgi:hypothetical protein